MSEAPATYGEPISPPQDPQTDEEWQQAVDAANFMLLIDSAVQYGLVKYSGQINVARCEQMLEAGRARDITPAPI